MYGPAGEPDSKALKVGRENTKADVVAGVPVWYVLDSGLGIIRSAPRNYKRPRGRQAA